MKRTKEQELEENEISDETGFLGTLVIDLRYCTTVTHDASFEIDQPCTSG
jgi:hypothetical protein